MRFIEVHQELNNAPMLINLDHVVSVKEHFLNTVNGWIEIKEDIDFVRGCIKEINKLECKYDEFFEKHHE